MTIALDPTSGKKRPRAAQYLTRAAACYARAHVNEGSPERIVPGERLHDRLGRPRRRRGISHVPVHHASPMVRQNDEDE